MKVTESIHHLTVRGSIERTPQKPWIVPIPGTTQMAHMLDNINIGAVNVRFTADELKQFNTELSKIEIKGERLPKFVLDFSDVEAPTKK